MDDACKKRNLSFPKKIKRTVSGCNYENSNIMYKKPEQRLFDMMTSRAKYFYSHINKLINDKGFKSPDIPTATTIGAKIYIFFIIAPHRTIIP